MNKRFLNLVDSARQCYFQLILVSRAEEDALFERLQMLDSIRLNVQKIGKEISERMLDLTKRQRSLKLTKLLDEI